MSCSLFLVKYTKLLHYKLIPFKIDKIIFIILINFELLYNAFLHKLLLTPVSG